VWRSILASVCVTLNLDTLLRDVTQQSQRIYSTFLASLAKKMAKQEIKTVTRTVAVPKTKIVKQVPQQQTAPKDTERTDFTPIRPQPPLPNQQDSRDKR